MIPPGDVHRDVRVDEDHQPRPDVDLGEHLIDVARGRPQASQAIEGVDRAVFLEGLFEGLTNLSAGRQTPTLSGFADAAVKRFRTRTWSRLLNSAPYSYTHTM